jgi:hypothetical protein
MEHFIFLSQYLPGGSGINHEELIILALKIPPADIHIGDPTNVNNRQTATLAILYVR